MTLDELKQKARECADGGWVKLPEPPPLTLPSETVLRYPHGVLWCAQEELVLVGSCEYRGELRRGKQTVAGATFQTLQVKLPPGYRFEGSEVVKEETVAIPASLAGAVGLEKYANEAYAQAIQGQWVQAQLGDGLGDRGYVFRQRDYQQTGIQYGDCPRPECARKSWNPMRDRCDHCGVTGKEIAAKRARPACKCGSTENVRDVTPAIRHKLADLTGKGVRHDYLCGPCYQTQRRAELQAQKLEQTKRDMSRPVKRDPYEWLGFSSADWEE